MGWREFEEHAAQTLHVVRVSDAARFGLSPRNVWRIARTRGWEPDVPGIIWLPGPETPERWLMTGSLLVGGEGLITGWSALYVTGYVRTAPSKVHLVVPYGRAIPGHPRFSVRRSRTLCDQDKTTVNDLDLTVMERTLCQMAADTELSILRGFALDGRRRGDLTTLGLAECIERMGRFPRKNKMKVLAGQIDEAQADSNLEFLMRRRLATAGFTPDTEQFTLQTPRRVVTIDIPWRKHRVGLECDSLKHHGTRVDLDRDAQRHNSVHGTDWTVFRATWTHLDDNAAFAELCADLRAALGSTTQSRAGFETDTS